MTPARWRNANASGGSIKAKLSHMPPIHVAIATATATASAYLTASAYEFAAGVSYSARKDFCGR